MASLAILRDPRLGPHATSATPVWLWSTDATRILWANAVGAAIFDAPTPVALAKRRFASDHPAAAQIARLAGMLRPGGSPQLQRLRGFGGRAGTPLTCLCSRIALADHTAAMLVVATEPAGRSLALAERVRRLFEGTDVAVAAFTPDGSLLHATAQVRARLGTHATLAGLGAAAIAEEALARARAAGDTTLGQATIERLGADATAVVTVIFAEPLAPFAESTIAAPIVAAAPRCDEPAPTEQPAAPASKLPAARPLAPEAAAAPQPPLSVDEKSPRNGALSSDRRHPLRFVWQMDAAGRFTLGSDEFLEVIGPRVAMTLGRPWTELNTLLALDPEEQVARAVATRDTWSGITVSWPVDDASDRLKVELSGLPIYDRIRSFQGYRGFGVCRDVGRIATLAAMRRSAPQPAPIPAPPPAEPAPTPPAAPAPETRPTLTVVPSAPNVVPFRTSAPASEKAPALSLGERNAFHELARELTARLKADGDEPAAETGEELPAAPAESARAPATRIAGSGDTAPPAADAVRYAVAETARQLAEARAPELQSILDAVSEGILVLASDGRIVAVNRGAAVLFGRDDAALAGRNFADLLAPASRPAALDDLAAVTRSGADTPPHGWREVGAVAGERGMLALSMALVRIAGAERICCVFRDQTALKAAERELAAAKQEAERASAARSEILGKISHELRTPLNSIVGFAEVMLDERFGPIGNERYRDYLKDMRASSEHAVALLGDLLDLSKIADGKLELAFAELELNDLVQGCIALVQPQANRERIIIRTSLTPNLPPIVADPNAVRQISLNLLATSIRLTGTGGQVIVSTAQSVAGEPVLRVRDTGIGMDERDLAAALEPFRALPTSPRPSAIGTGLSLPLTKALAEANRARFSISSKVNGGTLVEVAFAPVRARER